MEELHLNQALWNMLVTPTMGEKGSKTARLDYAAKLHLKKKEERKVCGEVSIKFLSVLLVLLIVTSSIFMPL